MYQLQMFNVVEKETGSSGKGQFFTDKHCYEININLNDGRHIITHSQCIKAEFQIDAVAFVGARSEKVLFDGGRLGN